MARSRLLAAQRSPDHLRLRLSKLILPGKGDISARLRYPAVITGRKYPDELRDRAVRLVLDLVKDQDASVTAACRKGGGELGIKADTLRGWAKQAQVDRGLRPGTTSADAARIRALERENAELRRVNAILRTASAFFAAELDHR